MENEHASLSDSGQERPIAGLRVRVLSPGGAVQERSVLQIAGGVRMKMNVAITAVYVFLLTASSALAQGRGLGAAQPAARPYTAATLPDGQPEIPNGIWNRRGVGGLDN